MNTKKSLIAFFLFINFFSFGQGIAISDQSSPVVSTGAVLDVSSSSSIGQAKGFLPPRIVDEQYAVTEKADGLMYFFTDTDSYGYYINGEGWYSFTVSGPYKGSDVDTGDPVVQNTTITPSGGLAIKLSNKTGSTISKGMLVKASSNDDNAVVLATGTDAMGVSYEDITDNSEGWIVVSGVAEVLPFSDDSPVRGDIVRIHESQNGYGDFSDTSSSTFELHSRVIGHCIKSASAGELATVVVKF